jgi:Flp pilus assembly protein TadB
MKAILVAVMAAVAVKATSVGLRGAVEAGHRRKTLRRLTSRPPARGAPRVVVPWLQAALPDHDPDTTWRRWWAALAIVAVGGASMGGAPGGVLAVVTATGASGVVLWAMRDRRDALADAALALWIDASGRAVRAGATFTQALVAGADAVADTPLGSEARAIARHLRSGDVEVGIDRLRDEAASESRRLVGRALAVAHASGGPPGLLLDGVSATLRERTALDHEVRALATQARASAVVIGLAPLAFGVLTMASDTRVTAFVFGSPVGWMCIAVGLFLDGVGAAWMARLVRRV